MRFFRRKNNFDRVASPESVSIPVKFRMLKLKPCFNRLDALLDSEMGLFDLKESILGSLSCTTN